jgi:excisionase family DNA binding protein
MMATDQILTVPEVAADLRVSKAHTYKLINGQVAGVSPLPAIIVGRRRLVRRSSLERWKKWNEQNQTGDKIGAAHSVDAA